MYAIVLGESPSAPVEFRLEVHQILADFHNVISDELSYELPS